VFTAGIGSRGDGGDDVSLLVPFMLPADRTLPEAIALSDLPGELTGSIQKGCYGRHVLKLTGFKSLEKAEASASTVFAWFERALLRDRVGTYVHKELEQITWWEPPSDGAPNFSELVKKAGWPNVQGVYSMPRTVAVPEGKRLLYLWMADVGISIGLSSKRVAEHLQKTPGLGHPLPQTIADRLSAAIEIFSLSFFETSNRAKLTLRVAALEPLADPAPISVQLRDTLDHLINITAKEAKERPPNEIEQYQSIIYQLAAMKEGGIARRFRKAFAAILYARGFRSSRAKLADELSKIYSLRCEIAHGKKPDPEEVIKANDFLEKAFPDIIDALWERE